jgi:ABC-type multidrug transport system ATPase subunit
MSVLRAAGVTRIYDSGRGVRDVSLDLREGDFRALIGANGSGKSTLISMLATLEGTDAGTIEWFGCSDRRSPMVRRRLGALLDNAVHFEHLTALENAEFFARQYGLRAMEARAALSLLFQWSGLAPFAHMAVRDYSLGMRRRLGLVETLAHAPDLIILDEPTLGLDHLGGVDIAQTLRERARGGAAVLVATNDLALANGADSVILLRDGEVAARGVGEDAAATLIESAVA